MCSLRDVIEPPARATSAGVAPREPIEAPSAEEDVTGTGTSRDAKSAFGEGAKNKRGSGGSIPSRRARGAWRVSSLRRSRPLNDAGPSRRRRLHRRAAALGRPGRRTRAAAAEKTPTRTVAGRDREIAVPNPPSPRSLSRDRVPPRVPSPPGTPTETDAEAARYRPRLPRARRRAPREPRRQSGRGDRRDPVVRKRRQRRRGKRRRGKTATKKSQPRSVSCRLGPRGAGMRGATVRAQGRRRRRRRRAVPTRRGRRRGRRGRPR